MKRRDPRRAKPARRQMPMDTIPAEMRERVKQREFKTRELIAILAEHTLLWNAFGRGVLPVLIGSNAKH